MITRFKTFIIFIITLVSTVFADGIIEEMSAIPQSNLVKIRFRTINEDDVSRFIVQRSMDDSDAFEVVKEITPMGYPHEYFLEDEIMWFKKITISAVYYRIAIVKKNGEIEYTRTLMVVPNVNEIVKTWGSIKLLFR